MKRQLSMYEVVADKSNPRWRLRWSPKKSQPPSIDHFVFILSTLSLSQNMAHFAILFPVFTGIVS
jgi:hypothetical protein